VPAREGHGWWPYLLPLFAFLGIVEVAARAPAAAQPALLALRVLVPGGLFLFFRQRGAYPELRGYASRLGGAPFDVAVGVAGAALWMAPYLAFPQLRPADRGFDPQQLGPDLAWLALSLRALGYGVVTPFVEELFMRSWLPRYAEVFDGPRDFRDVPIGHFSLRSLIIVVVFFTVSHRFWEWPVALLWILGTQIWLYRRRHLAALVVVHAASNLSIFAAVLIASQLPSGPLDWWFFL
jgi:CAAX prenyl protease-like protein